MHRSQINSVQLVLVPLLMFGYHFDHCGYHFDHCGYHFDHCSATPVWLPLWLPLWPPNVQLKVICVPGLACVLYALFLLTPIANSAPLKLNCIPTPLAVNTHTHTEHTHTHTHTHTCTQRGSLWVLECQFSLNSWRSGEMCCLQEPRRIFKSKSVLSQALPLCNQHQHDVYHRSGNNINVFKNISAVAKNKNYTRPKI